MSKPIKLFVGLGNPGEKYQNTRHNVGFWWIEALANDLNLNLNFEKNFFGFFVKTKIGNQNLYLLQPQTFMNASGKSVLALANFFKIWPNEILIIHDELDFQPGIVKLKKAGSHGGHNGLKSIQSQLGDNSYWRLRLGIGHPGHKNDVSAWVLNKPRIEELEAINKSIEHSLKFWKLLFNAEMEKAMLKINTQAK